MSAVPVSVDDVPVPPAYLHRPPRVRSLLPQVLKVCASVGRMHEPEQALVIDVLTGLKADGSPASLEGGVICSRQNLKTYCLENIVLTRLVDPTDPSQLLVWTSQQIDTCEETFLHFLSIFDSPDFPHMRRRFRRAITTNGKQQLELTSGKRLKFKARSEKSGQGLTGDLIVLDEAFALDGEHTAALLPTLSTRRRAAVLYGSSAGHVGSQILRQLRDRGRVGGPRAPAYIEWCAPGSWTEPGCESAGCMHLPGTAGCVLDREDYLQAANPLAGRRITWDYLRDERNGGMPSDKYGRERFGWWDDPLDDLQPISPAKWADLVVEGQVDGPPVFFLDCSPGLRSAAIAGATLHNGRPHVKLADHRAGTEWVPARVAELAERYPSAAWQYEGTGPASALVEQLKAVGVTAEKPFTSTDMARGCAHLQRLVDDGAISHSGDEAVAVALASAVRRELGDPGLWSWGRRRSAGDISPLVALTGALWLLELQPSYDLLASVL